MKNPLKRLTAVVLAAGLLIALSGCGCQSETDGNASEGTEAPKSTAESLPAAPETESAVEADAPGTEEGTEAPETSGTEAAAADEAEPTIPANVPVAEGLSYRDNGNGTCTLTGPGTWTGEHLKIPESIDGLTVTEVGTNAFRDSETLKSVTCPATLVGIRQCAFYNDPNLTNVVLNDGLQWISDSVFASTGLYRMTFPAGITNVGQYTFVSCKNLREVVLPEGVTKIGQNFCLGCEKLSRLILPESLEEIHGEAFFQCKSLTEVTLPDNVWRVDYYAFAECENLKTLRLSKGMKRFDGDALCGSGAVETFTIPENETYYIEGNCLIQKKDGVLAAGLDISVIPDDGSVKAIGDKAFRERHGIKELALPSSIESIGIQAFKSCKGLKKITFPDGLKSIGEEAFRDCYSLTSLEIPDSVEKIGPSAFRYCDGLKTVKCGSGVREYKAQVFRECYELVEADLGENVETLGESLFWRCMKLQTLRLGKNVKKISSDALQNCTALKDIYYAGTMAEWKAVQASYGYDSSTGNYTVHCSDGDLKKGEK